jgi:hypothetical protein
MTGRRSARFTSASVEFRASGRQAWTAPFRLMLVPVRDRVPHGLLRNAALVPGLPAREVSGDQPGAVDCSVPRIGLYPGANGRLTRGRSSQRRQGVSWMPLMI